VHELSIALSIVEMAQEEAERHGSARVMGVHIKLGALSGVVRDALESCYGMACAETPLEGSHLVIEDVPIVIQCPQCAVPRPAVSPQEIACAICGTPAGEIIQGRELQMTALELES